MIYDDKLVDTEFNKVIGKVLKEKRLDKNWSLLEVSRKLKKVSRQTIFHYENGDTKIRRYMKIKTLEKKRYSILTNNLDRCYLCGTRKQHLHEIFFGRNRINSMKYGCVIPVCFSCHEKIHSTHDLDIKLKQECQKRFIEVYEASIDDFIDIFRKNYL